MSSTYFRLQDDLHAPRRWYLKSPVGPEGQKLDPRIFTYGKPVDVTGPLRLPLRHPGNPLDFTEADFAMPVLRREYAERIVELAPTAVQCIPITVDGMPDPFVILNVLSTKRCVDEERTEIMYWTETDGQPERVGQYRMIGNLRIDPTQVDSAEIFRIERWEVALIVSAGIRKILQGAVGAKFLPV